MRKVFEKIKVSKEVNDYLKERFENLEIEVVASYKGKIMDLMEQGHLEGWCWQTTETAALFLNDDDYIERGNICITRNGYYHSWIVFKYEDIPYVFDPCLDILCEKMYYDEIFEPDVMAKIPAKRVKEYFINYITNPPTKNNYFSEKTNNSIERIMKTIYGEEYLAEKKKEIVINDKEDVNSAMYRNGAGYKTELEDGKIKKLTVHYYYNDV